jgi:cytidylate kinase
MPRSSVEALTSYLSAHRALGKPEAGERVRRFLTISREAGAGGSTLAHRVAELMNEEVPRVPWTVFDQDLVETALEAHDMPRELSRYLPEQKTRKFQDTIEEILGLHPSTLALVRRTNETILSLAQSGNVILIGRGSNFLTRTLRGGLHVRLVAEMFVRVRRLMDLLGLDEAEARVRAMRMDEGRRGYVSEHFLREIDDPLAYDLIINTTSLAPVDAAEMVAAQLRM